MSANTQHRPYYYGIDLIRFAAALMVACFHLGWSVSGPGSRGFALAGGALTLPFGRLFDWGTIGVEIFFVISGFVIANSANGRPLSASLGAVWNGSIRRYGSARPYPCWSGSSAGSATLSTT